MAGPVSRIIALRFASYLWQFREICNDAANLPSGKTFADILGNRVPGAGAGDRWRQLQQDAAAG